MSTHVTATQLAAGVLVLALAAQDSTAQADEFRQLGKHEHGHLTLNVVVQGDLLSVELDAPGINVLGFEHRPVTAKEQTQFANQERWLRSGLEAIGVPGAAGCRLAKVVVSSPNWAAADDGVDHGDYTVAWQFRCRQPAALAWFEPWLLQKLLDVDQVDVNLVNGNLQTRKTATGPRQRIALQ